MNLRSVLYVISIFLIVLSLIMLIPATYDLLIYGPKKNAFLESSIITLSIGVFFLIFFRTKTFNLKVRHIFLLTNLTWISVCIFSAFPFWISLNISYTDAFFETMSGITTTGSTILSNLDFTNKSILLWRSMLQWLGGIGFIVIAVAVLPFLKVGGMRLFQSESSDWSNKAMPRSGSIAKRMISIYSGLTVLCTICYFLGGMNLFEAINHAMATLSTGGYSTSDQSMGHFTNPFIYWTAIIFMILSSLPFVVFVKALNNNPKALFNDNQIKTFIILLLIIWIGFSIWLTLSSHYDFWEAFTLVAFNTTSIISTTGFALTDYTLWGGFAVSLFFFLTFIGGCSGSTAGGIKIFRIEIAAKLLAIQLKKLSHPRAMIVQNYNNQKITNDILRSLITFCFFFALLLCLMTLLLSLIGLDLLTSMSSAATALANVGPGLGDIVGPANNFELIPNSAKWILSFGMLMGRLEVITVLVLFTPSFWKS